MEPSKAQSSVTRHLHTFVPDSGPEYDYRTNPPLWSGEKARARCTGCGVRPWLSRGDLAAYAAMELAVPAQDVTKCDSDHEEKQPGRVFTSEELVRGPDDFPYTPEGEMTRFHEQHARSRDAMARDSLAHQVLSLAQRVLDLRRDKETSVKQQDWGMAVRARHAEWVAQEILGQQLTPENVVILASGAARFYEAEAFPTKGQTVAGYLFPTADAIAVMNEADRLSHYHAAVAAGWSDHEAMAILWPEGG